MTLKDAKPGMKVQIEALEPSPLKTRLLSMGLIKGGIVEILRSAPFGDPMVISIRSSILSLRLADAAKIIIKPV